MKKDQPINEEKLAELKAEITKCEERYKQSFKQDSCAEIMASYYALQKAKKCYNAATGRCRSTEDEDITTFVINKVKSELNS